MKIYSDITKTIGNTPLVKINKIKETRANIFAKLEYFNPWGSVKDRVAIALIEDAEKSGLINSDTTIIEATSGNTGIALAAVSAVKSYKLLIVMPDTMSLERRKLLEIFGAEIILTEGAKGMRGAIEKANELHQNIKNSFIPSQFENKSNPEIHRKTTAIEILQDLDEKLDAVVLGVGTGGTLTGVGEILKEKIPSIKIFAVEPKDSAVLSGKNPGAHKIQGIGAGFIPKILNTKIIDEIIQVSNEDAYFMMRKLAKTEGILCGISSGASMSAALEIAKREEFINKNIVVIFPDTGERYLSDLIK